LINITAKYYIYIIKYYGKERLMDTVKYKAFITTVDLGSITAAAGAMGYTQPGLTRMLNSLEKEMGCRLLKRGRNGAELTSDGRKLIPAIRELCKCQEQISQMTAEIAGLLSGEISVGSFYSIAEGWLPKLIGLFGRKYPEVRVHTFEGLADDLTLMLEENKLDCCFMSKPADYKGEWLPLKMEPIVAWLPKTHPLSGADSFPLSELEHEAFIHPAPGHDTDIDRLLHDESIEANAKYWSQDPATVFSMVESGLGISINNKLQSCKFKGNVTVIPVFPARYVELGIAVPSLKKASPAALEFIRTAEKLYSSYPPVA